MVTATHAQILVGPVAGGQVGWIRYDDSDDRRLYKVKPVAGFHAGASIAFRVQKRFFLQTSIIYQQRTKLIEGKLDQSLRNEQTNRYIDIPMLYTAEFKATMGRDKVYKWYFGAGPNISYWLGGKGVFANGDLNENQINPPNYDLPYKVVFNKLPENVVQGEMNIIQPNRLQLGLNISAGLIFEPMGFNKIMITTRYMTGHSFFSRTNNGDFGMPNVVYYEDELKARNKEFVVSLYYFVDLKIDQRKKGKTTSKIKRGKDKR